MEKVEFRCRNCGEKTSRKILPGKHSVLGALRQVNSQAACCSSPDYEDLEGHSRALRKPSLREKLSGLTA